MPGVQILYPCDYCSVLFLIRRDRLKPGRKRYCSVPCFQADAKKCREQQRQAMVGLRLCTKCLEVKPEPEFYRREEAGSPPFRSHCKSCMRAAGRAYFAQHKAQVQRWAVSNRSKVRGYKKKYGAIHPERLRMHMAARRARIRNAPEVLPVNPLEIAIRDNWRCHICGKKVTQKTWSMDHLIPLAHGGSHIPQNIALAHFLCNARRGVGRKIPAQLRLLA